MKVQFSEAMRCQIFQRDSDISEKQGKYIDLKREPHRIGELPEAKEWKALGDFLVGINRTNLVRTTGCNSNFNEVYGGHAAPFVDIALDDPRLRKSDEACVKLRNKLLLLDGNPAAPDLTLEMVESEVTMPSGDTIPTLRLWFLGDKRQAEGAFTVVLASLDEERVPDYLRWSDCDHPSGGAERLFAPTGVQLEFPADCGPIQGTWLFNGSDAASWTTVSEYTSIAIGLGENLDRPQWNVEIHTASEHAIYQGAEMKFPIHRGDFELALVRGGQQWPEKLVLEAF